MSNATLTRNCDQDCLILLTTHPNFGNVGYPFRILTLAMDRCGAVLGLLVAFLKQCRWAESGHGLKHRIGGGSGDLYRCRPSSILVPGH
jgi:hypothetical protein